MAATLRERKEVQARELERALDALSRAKRRERDRRQWITELFAREEPLEWEEYWELPPAQRTAFRVALYFCGNGRSCDPPRELALHLERWGERILEAEDVDGHPEFAAGLISLARQHHSWIRPLSGWRPSSKNPRRQFSHLARYLLARYEVPAYLDSVLTGWGEHPQESWFAHVGQGGSLRTAPGNTVALTKRMAHLAMRAPDESSAIEALRWGQVRALGGSARLARAVCATQLGWTLDHVDAEQWRLQVIHWLTNQPMLDPALVDRIVCYCLERKPCDYEFTMQGRTVNALMALIEAQERERHQERQLEQAQRTTYRTRYQYQQFWPSGLAPGIWELGKGPRRTVWMIDELLSNRDLIQEGRAMRHCVATYADSVLNGESSIWSMRVDRGEGVERALTINVGPAGRTILECRGKCNRAPHADELRILEQWAKENGLTVELE